MNVRSVNVPGDEGAPRELRALDAVEARVLGSLLEKQQTTPEYYPLTMNALIAACNQKSSRDPVMELSEDTVSEAVERLREERALRETSGSRASRFEHLLDYRLRINRAERSLLTVMLLRGPQTLNELKTRTERMHPFASTSEVEEALVGLVERTHPLVVRIPRRSGQKEERWMHTLAGEIDTMAGGDDTPAAPTRGGGLAERVAALEERLARIEEILQRQSAD